MIDIVGFLEGVTPDNRGRLLSHIHQFSDEQMETTHDYIQWLFPTDQPSQSNYNAPVLSPFDIEDLQQSKRAVANIKISAERFLGFLSRHNYWISRYNHNHLRITRVITSLRLLAGDDDADQFLASILALVKGKEGQIGQKPIQFWMQA
jgi:hypothetical protein